MSAHPETNEAVGTAIPTASMNPNHYERASAMNMPANPEDFNSIQIIERDGALRVSSREIAANFGKRHDHVLRAIRNLECSPDFNAANFGAVEYLDAKGEVRTEYAMTRDGFTFLVMGFTGKDAAVWKEKYIAAFNAMEARLRGAPAAVLTGPQLMAAALIEADATMKAQAAQIEAMRGDVEAFDRIAKADGSLCVTDAAKALQMRPKDLFAWLRENGWIYKRAGSGNDLGYQAKQAAGLLEHKVTTVLRADGSEKVTEQVRVTPKGLAKLAKLIRPSVALAVPAVSLAVPALAAPDDSGGPPDLPQMVPVWIYGDTRNLWALIDPTDSVCDAAYATKTGLVIRLDTCQRRFWDGVRWRPYDRAQLDHMRAGRVIIAFERVGGSWIKREAGELV